MRPITVTVVGAANSNAIPLDVRLTPIQVAVSGAVVSGVVNYKLQHTSDDVFNPAVIAAGIVWIDEPTMTGQTGAASTTINFPYTALRFVNAGTGTLQGRIVQAGDSL
jgi:hypothetical protein